MAHPRAKNGHSIPGVPGCGIPGGRNVWRRVKAFHESGFCEGGERGASCGEGTYQLLPCESRFTNPEVRSESVSHSVVSDSLRPHKDCSLPRSSVAWNSPGKNTGEGSHSLFQGIFPIQGLNPGFPHCRQILYCLYQGSPSRHKNPTFYSFWSLITLLLLNSS